MDIRSHIPNTTLQSVCVTMNGLPMTRTVKPGRTRPLFLPAAVEKISIFSVGIVVFGDNRIGCAQVDSNELSGHATYLRTLWISELMRRDVPSGHIKTGFAFRRCQRDRKGDVGRT
jgi:hypothetical protein